MPLPAPRLPPPPMPRLLAFLALAAPIAPVAARDLSWVVVTGVEAGDALTVRDAPRGDAAAVGAMAPGALVASTGETAQSAVEWTRIASGEMQGWVASRFLAPARFRMLEGSDMPVAGICHGWEPFWDVRWQDGMISTRTMTSEVEETMPITGVPKAEGWTHGMIESLRPDGTRVLIRYEEASCDALPLDAPVLGRGFMVVIADGRTSWHYGCCRPLEAALATD